MMKIYDMFLKIVNLLFLGFVFLNIACTTNKEDRTYSEEAFQETLIPVRPGKSGEQPFWNGLARRFIHVPSFGFTEIEHAKAYKFSAYSETDGKNYTFISEKPQDLLSPIWQKLPVGKVRLIVEALDGKEKVVGVSGTRQFYKAAHFNGPYQSPVLTYDESAKLALRNLFHQEPVQHWLKSGEPDDTYELYCYASKLFGAVTEAMILYARLDSKDSLEAMTIAKRAADYLIRISEPAEAPLAWFPPTYRGNKLSAAWFNGQIMLNCPSEAARIYLNLFDVTGDNKYYLAAIRIAETYLRLQLPNGTWKLKLNTSSGEPVDLNETIPIDIVELFDRLIDQYSLDQYQTSRNRALEWIAQNPLKTFNWEGQYEDIILQGPYQNMTKHQACSYAIYILDPERRNANNIQIAKELARFAEDQFVIWERPLPDQSNSFNWLTPCVVEQYRFFEAVDASASKLIATYQALYSATREEIYLAKAISLANNMTVIQKRYGGNYSTWWRIQEGEVMEDWINCAVYDTRVMLQLHNLLVDMNRQADDLTRKNLLLLLSQPPSEKIMTEMVGRYHRTKNFKQKIQLLRSIAQSDMNFAYPLIHIAMKGSDEEMKVAALSMLRYERSITGLELFQDVLNSESAPVRQALLSGYCSVADKNLESGNERVAREYYHQIINGDPDYFDARHSLKRLEEVGKKESLTYIRPYLKHEGLSEIAATTILRILLRQPDQLIMEDNMGLLQILSKSANIEVGNQIIDWIQQNKPQELTVYQSIAMKNGYVSQWWVAGPLSKENPPSDSIGTFPDEGIKSFENQIFKNDKVRWQFVQPLSIHGVVPLGNLFGKIQGVAYAYSEISLPAAGNFVFKIGSNDGVVCWVNKNLVHSNLDVGRALKLDEDVFVVKLQKGKNTVLLKVPNVGGNWETCLRINTSYEKPLDLNPLTIGMKTMSLKAPPKHM
jgi:maltose/maltodextrin transport system substrate-binding protein